MARPDFRRSPSSGSDTSSFYSVSTSSSGGADSAFSVWSSSASDSFVWRDDPWGFDGVGGAVTRFVDERDDRRRRFASHILSGPFAQFYKKERKSSSSGRSGRSAASPRFPAGKPGGNQHFPPPRPHNAQPQFHQHQGQFPPGQFGQQNFGPPPPPPPPVRPPGGNAGFDAGFIQLNGGGGGGGPPPPPQHYGGDPWDNAGGYGGQVYDQ
ncbi:hypothetical protein F4821DRAFT_86579 [Hypoxylon rubiginosum]|uniref:Uncharacterized protein n=1 Tax=Hypoxylon rubiginosum TaxID=110542 RepID=A0ACC0D8F9_9PEZI|nr:hypothetical protein F4821DRAFT_86579 [Hypoxylon rubiginosum]